MKPNNMMLAVSPEYRRAIPLTSQSPRKSSKNGSTCATKFDASEESSLYDSTCVANHVIETLTDATLHGKPGIMGFNLPYAAARKIEPTTIPAMISKGRKTATRC